MKTNTSRPIAVGGLVKMNKPTVSLSIHIKFRELGGVSRYRRDEEPGNEFDFKTWGHETFESDSLTGVAKAVSKHLMIVAEQIGGVNRTFERTNLTYELTRFNPDIQGHSASRSPIIPNCVLDDRPELMAATNVFMSLVNEFLSVQIAKHQTT